MRVGYGQGGHTFLGERLVPHHSLGMTKQLPPSDPIRAAESLTTTVAVVVATDMFATSIQAIVRWADVRSVHPVCPWNLITLNLRGGYMLLILIPH